MSDSPQLILILGGARSGKSTAAEKIAAQYSRVTFLATAEAYDDEMRLRITHHQADRPTEWKTVECPQSAAEAIHQTDEADCFLLDCLTLLVSNLLLAHEADAEEVTNAEIDALLDAWRESNANLICVSNETGLGVVPDNALARRYRDLLGRVNQRLAAQADVVYFMIAGLAVNIKTLATPIIERDQQ